MSFAIIATITESVSLTRRIAAGAAVAGVPGDALQWAVERRWQWAASPGWAGKWESALANGIPDPGDDPAVITDADISARIDQLLPGGP